MISVVVSTCNGEKYIEEQLDSIAKQTLTADEVIICDDCSDDSTFEIIANFIESNGLNNWQLFTNEVKKGLDVTFFEMTKRIKGDIIFFAEQDDIWDHEKLKRMSRYMDENPRFSGMFSSLEFINETGDRTGLQNLSKLLTGESGIVEFFEAKRICGEFNVKPGSICIRKSVVPYLEVEKISDGFCFGYFVALVSSLIGLFSYMDIPLVKCRDKYDISLTAKLISNGSEPAVVKNLHRCNSYIFENSDSFKNMTPKFSKRLEKIISKESKILKV